MDATEVAYLAGLFDGEGTIGIHNRRRWRRVTWTLHISLECGNEAAIQKLVAAFGGKALLRRTMLGKSASWRWNATGANAKVVLAELLPYLIIKKAQACEALKFPVMPPSLHPDEETRTYKAALAERVGAFNRKGRAVGRVLR